MSEILLIDAEQPFAQQLVDALQGTGFSVTQLEDGKEGLEYARANQPALIVLCVELPKMSGYSICNKLKKDGELKTIPLIITSSEATPETFAQHKKLKTRAEDYLIKPFDPPALIEKIGALIELPAATPPATPPEEDELASFEALDGLEALGDDEVELGDQDIDELQVDSDDPLAGLGDSDDLAMLDEADASEPLNGSDLSDDDLLGDLGKDLEAGSDDDLLAGFDAALGDEAAAVPDDEFASLGDGDLDLGQAVDADNALDDFDDAFESMAPLGEEAGDSAPPPPAAVVEDPSPSAVMAGADFAQMSAIRRENSDLKARVSELETRLKTAEDTAAASKNQLSQSKSSSTSSARDVLNLKEQLMSKDKELLALKDEVFEKEKGAVDLQEEVEGIRAELDAKNSSVQDKEAELASATARLESTSQERDDLERQVNDHLGKAQADAERLRKEVDEKEHELMSLRQEASGKDAEIGTAKQAAEEAEDRLVAAYKRLESEEAVRAKAKEATQIALALLSGDVDPNVDNGEHRVDA